MNKYTLLCIIGSMLSSLSGKHHKGEMSPIFDGRTLSGWSQLNGTATYRVEDGTIVGKTKEGSPNSFLCTNELYGDFELKFEVKLTNNELNSGVQIRSNTKELTEKEEKRGDKFGRVNGPQVEIEATKDKGSAAVAVALAFTGDVLITAGDNQIFSNMVSLWMKI